MAPGPPSPRCAPFLHHVTPSVETPERSERARPFIVVQDRQRSSQSNIKSARSGSFRLEANEITPLPFHSPMEGGSATAPVGSSNMHLAKRGDSASATPRLRGALKGGAQRGRPGVRSGVRSRGALTGVRSRCRPQSGSGCSPFSRRSAERRRSSSRVTPRRSAVRLARLVVATPRMKRNVGKPSLPSST